MGIIENWNEKLAKLESDESAIAYFNEFAAATIRDDPDTAYYVLTRAYWITETKGYSLARAWASLWLGLLAHERSDYETALEKNFEAFTIFEEKELVEGIAKACDFIGLSFADLGLYDQALEWYQKGYASAERGSLGQIQSTILVDISDAFISLKQFDDAREALDKILSMDATPPTRVRVILNLASLSLQEESYEEALVLAENASTLAQQTGQSGLLNDCFLKKAIALHGLERNAEAAKYYQKTLRTARRLGEKKNQAEILLSYAQFFVKSGEGKRAISRFKSAVSIASDIKARPIEATARYGLSELYKASGRWKLAYEHIAAAKAIEGELYSERSRKAFATMRAEQVRREADIYRMLYDQVATISAVGREITSNLDLEEVLQTVYKKVNHIMDATVFGIALYVDETSSLDYALFINEGKRTPLGKFGFNDPTSLGAYCFKHRSDILINDLDAEYSNFVSKYAPLSDSIEKPNSLIYTPLLAGRQALGIMTVQSNRLNAYSNNDLASLKALASYIAIAIENARLFKEVTTLATFDSLTGLLMRRRFFEVGRNEFHRRARYKADLSVIMIDIDHFKLVNDNYGHDAGDKVLAAVSQVVRDLLRSTDYAGRYGGEEFALLLPQTSVEGASSLAERIRAAIEEIRIPHGDSEIRVTASFGLCSFTDDCPSFEHGLTIADHALYEAKNTGRNRVIVKKD